MGASQMNINQQQQGSFYGQQQQQPQQGSFYGQPQQNQYGQPQNQYGQYQQQNAYGQQQANPMGAGGGAAESKWKKAHDPNSNKDYWYHVDTKETTWTMPPELAGGGGGQQKADDQQKRMSAQMAINSGSVIHFDAAWGSDSDGDDNEDDSWDDKEDDSSSDDGLDVYDPNK